MSSRSSRGQIQQVFPFLMVAIVVIATVFLGMKLFKGLSGTACDASDADFIAALRRTLDENAAYGSRNTVSVPAPCDAEEVCFVDTTAIASPGSAFTSDDPTITTVVRNGVRTNIFLKKESGVMEAGFDQRIVIDSPDQYACFPVARGTFTFRVEGGGRFLTIR